MTKIVLIGGKKRAGKDFHAVLIKKELEKKGLRADIVSFADPLKSIISKMFNISREELEEFKDNPEKYSLLLKEYRGDEEPKILMETDFRKILQLFGTEGMQGEFGNFIWSEIFYKNARQSVADFILVPDFRFFSEYRDDALTLRIKHKTIENNCKDEHASETELDNFEFGAEIDNTDYPDTTEAVEEYAAWLEEFHA